MTPKEYLRAVRTIDRRIDETLERLERMRARLEAGRQSNLSGMPRGGAVDWTATADKVIELEQAYNERLRDMCRMKREAQAAIDRVEDARYRELLELYYIDRYTWEQVATTMGYDVRHVTRLHGEALQAFAIPLPTCP